MESIPVGLILLLLAVVLGAVVIISIIRFFSKNYIHAGPNEAIIFGRKGAKSGEDDGNLAVNDEDIVINGARLRIPIIHKTYHMDLTSFPINMSVEDAKDSQFVPVNVSASGQAKIGNLRPQVRAAASRFHGKSREEIRAEIENFAQGAMRGVIANMTVENLNGKRVEFMEAVVNQLEEELNAVGFIVDMINISDINDRHDYIRTLGEKQNAETTKDAAIAVADAERETRVQRALASQLAEEAEAQAAAAIARAKRVKDLELAQIRQEVDAANARAAEAGALAQAEAHGDVLVRKAQAEANEQDARVLVEEKRAATRRKALEADVVAEADAAAQATVLKAEAAKKTAILEADAAKHREIADAEADAQEMQLAGSAEATARKLLAEARREELTAEADGEAAMLKAKADGERDLGLARAEAQEKMSAALNLMDDDAIMAQLVPVLAQVMPEMTRAMAAGMQNVDSIVMYDGGGNGSNGTVVDRFLNRFPVGSHMVTKTLESITGVNVQEMMSRRFGNSGSSEHAVETTGEVVAQDDQAGNDEVNDDLEPEAFEAKPRRRFASDD